MTSFPLFNVEKLEVSEGIIDQISYPLDEPAEGYFFAPRDRTRFFFLPPVCTFTT